jgi:hypothetical protein
MQYLLMIYLEESRMGTMSAAEQTATTNEYMAFTRQIQENKNWVGGNRLQPSSAATTVRVRDGKTSVTHGPYAETREQLGGYYLIEAKNLDEACAIAGRIPGARHGTIEVRPIVPM